MIPASYTFSISQSAKRADYMSANADLGILNAEDAQLSFSEAPTAASARSSSFTTARTRP